MGDGLKKKGSDMEKLLIVIPLVGSGLLGSRRRERIGWKAREGI
jgi:hypothetical protein